MKSFWILYIAVVVAASTGVYFAAPLARPFMKRFVKVQKHPLPLPGGSDFPADAAGGETAVTPPGSAETHHAGELEDSPALLGIFRVRGREKPSWGIVQSKTNFYDTEGKRLGELPPGVILGYKQRVVSSKGSMVLCSLRYKGKELGPYLMSGKDLALFTGDYMKLSENQRGNIEAYYKTKGAMEKYQLELMQQLAIKNPHYASYKAAYEQYMAHIDKSKELSLKRDKATGMIRSSLDDQLRQLKNEEAELQKKYDAIQAKYKSWKHQNSSSLPDPSKDERVKAYRREMQMLAQRIPGLVY